MPQITSAVISESVYALGRFPQSSLAQLYDWLREIDWRLLPTPSDESLKHYAQFVDAKDAHVLAAAIEGKSDFLLTLDRRHILSVADAVKSAGLPIAILLPCDFIRNYYPQHEDYPALPPTSGSAGQEGARK